MTIKKNYFFFFIVVISITLVSVTFPFILPGRFYYDANYITDINNIKESGIYGSYPLTILFYNITGLRSLPYSIVGLIQLTIVFYIIKKIGIPNNFHILNSKNLVTYLSFLMIGIFISMPSKEFITYIYIYIILLVFINSNSKTTYKLIKVILLLIIFGLLYRPYYVLIPFIAFGIFLITNMNIKYKVTSTILIGILTLSLMSFSYSLISGKYFSDRSRNMVNEGRSPEDDANTVIISPFETSVWYGEPLNNLYGFFTINFPVNALKHFTKPQVLAFIFWQIIVITILLITFSSIQKNKKKYANEYWLFIILFSYFIIQGVFEPDLGSAVRHKIGIFPLIYYLLYYDNFRKKTL